MLEVLEEVSVPLVVVFDIVVVLVAVIVLLVAV